MSKPTPDDLRRLDEAVALAEPLLGTTAENPTVGALVVGTDGRVIGSAVTAPGGRPHAETQALAEAGEGARGATLYSTLEPCRHWGRTPPCVDAVVRAGIARVVVGMTDPDPRTAGKSLERLRAAGVAVVLADHAPSRRLHEGHAVRHAEGRPHITLKLAISADGRIGRADQAKVPITGEEAREWTHRRRATSDAVLVGGSTAEIDDPELTVRVPGLESRTPLRIVLTGRRGLAKRLNLLGRLTGHRVAVIATLQREVRVPAYVEIIRVAGQNMRPDLGRAMAALGARGISRLFVEPGAILTEAFLSHGLVDRFALFTSKVLVGPGGVAAPEGPMEDRLAAAGLHEVDRRDLGEDTLRTFERR